DGQKPHIRLGNTDKTARNIEVQKLLEVPVNVAGIWRERVRTLSGEVSQAVSLAVVTTNCEKSAEVVVVKKFL
ncbi:hypothetical protein, partial [Hominenteromicrobium sp.]|uniref:hypothetical protein n=1 Tax=Hominenteromicrobium sp. TaxID=3073581 RepID=UPI003AB6A453